MLTKFSTFSRLYYSTDCMTYRRLWTGRDGISKLFGMQELRAQLAERLRQLRKRDRISQEDFADKAGLHRVGYGWIEQQKREPKLATLAKIAAGFDITLSELFRGVGRHPGKHKGVKR